MAKSMNLSEYLKIVYEDQVDKSPAVNHFQNNLANDVPEEEHEARLMLHGAFDQGYNQGIVELITFIETLGVTVSVSDSDEG